MTALYKDGTISLVNGSPVITGIDTAWKVSLIVGGTVFVEADGGNPLPILPDDSSGANLHPITDTEMTSAINWTGPSGTFNYALVRDTSYNRQQTTNAEKLGELLSQLDSPMIAGLSSIEGMPDHLILITGPSTASLIPRLSLVQGVGFDKAVANLAARAAYNGEVKGFRVAVTDIGDGRSAVYEKNSNTSGDWSTPVIITGPVGPSGVTPRGSYSSATAYTARDLVQFGGSSWIAKVATTGNPPPALPVIENTQWLLFARSGTAGVVDRGAYSAANDYAANDIVLDGGSTWIALQATKGNAPPALPTESNAYWRVLARAGKDGAGTGDVVGPNGGVTVKQVAGFGSNTGKAIIGLTPVEARVASDSGILAGLRNRLINGGMSIAQRGAVTVPANGQAYTLDGWLIVNSTNQPCTVSSVGFTLGSVIGVIPGEPTNALSISFNTAPTSGTVAVLQRVEGVQTFAGKATTLRGYIAAPAETPIVAFVSQVFGSGGSPSATVAVDPAEVSHPSIGAVYRRIDALFNLPTMAGKTKGTNRDDRLNIGWTITPRNSGLYLFTRAAFVEGDCRPETDFFAERHPQQELALSQRYFEVASGIVLNSNLYRDFYLKVTKRGPPSLSNAVFASGGTGAVFSANSAFDSVNRFYQDAAHSVVSNFTVWVSAEL